MRYLKKYHKYIESTSVDLLTVDDITESMEVFSDSLLRSVGATPVNPLQEIKYRIPDGSSVEDLSSNTEFVNSLSSLGMRKTEIQNTEDFETFLKKSCKYILVYNIESNDLERPLYMFVQKWNDDKNEWGGVFMYKINDDMKKFYDKLSSKKIEIIDNESSYIYATSNSGNNWELQSGDETESFKRFLSDEEIKSLLKNKNYKVNIL